MDALYSAIPMKIDCDLQMTLMPSSLYPLLGALIGNGYGRAKSRHIIRDFVDAAGESIEEKSILVRFQKRTHNLLLLAADFAKTDAQIPWPGNKRL